MTIPGVNCFFRRVGAMAIRWDRLVGVVDAFLEDGGKPPVLQLVVDGGVRTDEIGLQL